MYEWLKILIRLFPNYINIKKTKGVATKTWCTTVTTNRSQWQYNGQNHTRTHTDKPQHKGLAANTYTSNAPTQTRIHAVYSPTITAMHQTHTLTEGAHSHSALAGKTHPSHTKYKLAYSYSPLAKQISTRARTHMHTRALAKPSRWGANSISFPMLVRREQRNRYTASPAVLKGVLLP